MRAVLAWLKTWRGRLPSAPLRDACAKRRLERVCRAHGCSRTQALRITRDYFASHGAGGDK